MRELPITGYLDAFSARPGESLTARVSVRDGGDYRARLVRVVSADANPAGPGQVFEDLAHRFDRTLAGRRQAIRLGSCGRVPAGPRRAADAPCTWTCLVRSGLLERPATALVFEAGERAITLAFGADGVEGEWGEARVVAGAAPRAWTWYRVWLSLDPASGRLRVGQAPVDPLLSGEAAGAEMRAQAGPAPTGGLVLFGAAGAEEPARHCNARIEAPAILAGFVETWPLPLEEPAPARAHWDFSRGIDGLDLVDVGPQACHGRLVNLPMRAVRGAHWSGREMCWRHAPAEYAAIQFNADDLNDCGWEADFSFPVPGDLPSGSYALHLTCGAGEDWLPFFVLPPRGTATARVAVLMPTFTYMAYACHARGNVDDAHRARLAQWGAYPYNPDDYPLYGTSTYNVHPDGSGMAFSTRLRPVITTRPGYMVFNDPISSGVRHYVADHHLLAWLEAKAIAFDVLTDEDLHREGADLLEPYATVLTGTHPEYHTAQTLDALMHYSRTGGRLCYLGGNGFYWRVAVSDAVPGTIELRRAESGVRAWAPEPGESHHAFDGAYGGLWQRNGRPPQALVGVGFSAQGLYEAGHFRRLPGADDPRTAWIFAGVQEEIIGDYGLAAGGAAGFELDRAVARLGSAPDLVILARSEALPPSFFAVYEELYGKATLSGETAAEMIRGEIVYFEPPGGGAVFAVGSITFCGSLWKDGGWQGPVSRILENVVRRFAG